MNVLYESISGKGWRTYTPTQSGWSSTTVLTGRYTQIGKTVILTYDVAGTSNATATNITLPDGMSATNTTNIFFGGSTEFLKNNGVNQATPGKSFINPAATPTIIDFFIDFAGTTFTASGAKNVRGTIIFEVD